MIIGKDLIKQLGLSKFSNISIQKIIGISIPIYIITFDSRYNRRFLTYSRLNNIKSTSIKKIKSFSNDILQLKNVKLSPPANLYNIDLDISPSTILLLRDIAGEYFRTKKIFENKKEYKLENLNCKIIIEDYRSK
jgi:hypothetical protein